MTIEVGGEPGMCGVLAMEVKKKTTTYFKRRG